MKRVLFSGAVLFIAAIAATAGSQTSFNHEAREAYEDLNLSRSSRSSRFNLQTAPTARVANATAPVDVPANYQALVAKYCIGCHNTRNPLPAGAPLALDKVNFTDPGADAATWERVVKKLGVGAMPPQGSPTPGAAELNKFRASLIASLDAAAAKKNNPGEFVLHRLNRLEYQNAVRDLLGVTVDVTELLPSDGGNFGFDNIATALNTSPLLLER